MCWRIEIVPVEEQNAENALATSFMGDQNVLITIRVLATFMLLCLALEKSVVPLKGQGTLDLHVEKRLDTQHLLIFRNS